MQRPVTIVPRMAHALAETGKPMVKVVVEPREARTLRDEAVARNLERVAWLMDRAIVIPGTKISVGLDALLGLLPIGGDVVTGLVQVATRAHCSSPLPRAQNGGGAHDGQCFARCRCRDDPDSGRPF